MSGLTSARSLINNSRSNLSLSGLNFPDDIDKVPHKMVMRFVKRNALQGGRYDLSPQEVTQTNGYIVLPVPTQIVDGVSLKYNPVDLGITGEIVSGVTARAASVVGGGASIGSVARALNAEELSAGIREAALATATQYGGNVINTILQRAGINNPQGAAALATGLNKTLNPFTTSVFQGVNLRTFTFTWTLAPKTRSESSSLERIIKELRSKSLPSLPRSGAGFFMEFPDTVEFNLIGMQDYTFAFPTAPCVVDSLSFDRTPTGSPVFFAGTGASAVVQLTMKLMEIRPLIRDDGNEYNVNVNTLRVPPPSTP